MTLRAGVIGLGWMGGGAALCIARTGRPLSVYDVNPEAPARWEDGHLLPAYAASCGDVARNSDVLIILVVSAAQIEDVLSGPDGILESAHEDLVVVIASTISMAEFSGFQALAAPFGVTIVDCGVTSPPGGHDKKRIVGMVGAEPDIFERIRPVLEDFTQLVVRMGGPGAGMATKIIRNMQFYSTWYAACEAAAVAEKVGLDTAKIAQIDSLSLADDCGTTSWLKQWSARNPDETPRARQDHVANLLLKDLDAAVSLMDGYDLENPLVSLMQEHVERITRPMR